jgi:mono/diheme cytochrome c family protein
MSRPTKLLSLASLLAALALFSGCDAQENADLENGRQLFIEKCGTCHILAEAATSASTGPDLDAAFADARASGMDNDTIEGIVEQQIEAPRNTDPDDPTYMPPEIVTGDDARDVAAYVASVAGVPGIMPPVAPGGPGGQVFANNGCGSCHAFTAAGSTGQVGPNLDESLQGQDPAMIEESIVAPDEVIAQGFEAGVMPENYGEEITPEDLKLLVEFLATCAGEDAGCGEEGGGSSAGGGGQG